MVCEAVPREVLVRTVNGTHLVRSGDLQMITPFPDYVSSGLTHATPFDHTQEVPLLLYGPGIVRAGVYDEPATLTDVSQTAASMLEFDGFTAPDGRALDEALLHRRADAAEAARHDGVGFRRGRPARTVASVVAVPARLGKVRGSRTRS